MKKNSGEIIIGVLVGLAIGAAMLFINSGNYAQELANSTGVDTSRAEYLTDQPGTSILTVIAPAVAGAGVGWLLEETGVTSKKENKTTVERQTQIQVTGDDNNVVVGDGTINDTETSTTTPTEPAPDTAEGEL